MQNRYYYKDILIILFIIFYIKYRIHYIYSTFLFNNQNKNKYTSSIIKYIGHSKLQYKIVVYLILY